MAYKRSRATFEADVQSPYVLYGTPLPPLDPDTRDDGSYVPVWKQEVTDEQGRKRLHGAFTGGFSAGYSSGLKIPDCMLIFNSQILQYCRLQRRMDPFEFRLVKVQAKHSCCSKAAKTRRFHG